MTSRKSVLLAMEDNAAARRLVEIARRHSKLALEHLGKILHLKDE